MNKRTVVFAALLGALAAPAYADGFRFVGGEAGWAYVGATPGNTTQQQVQRERGDPVRNTVTTDGWKYVGGEAGWLFVGRQTPNTNEQVARARGDSERNLVTADGWQQVGGEAGWLYAGTPTEASAMTARASTSPSSAIQ